MVKKAATEQRDNLLEFREDPERNGEINLVLYAPVIMVEQSERIIRSHCNYLGLTHSLAKDSDGKRVKLTLTASGRGRELVMLVDDVTAWIEANAIAGN